MFRMQLPDVGGPLRWVTGLVASVLRPAGEPVSVMVVADHAVLAEALALAIDSTTSMSCVAVADSTEQALRLAARMGPDVAVIDLDPDDEQRLQDHPGASRDAAHSAVLLLTEQSPTRGVVQAAVEGRGCCRVSQDDKPRASCRPSRRLSDHLFTTDRRTITALCDRPKPRRVPRRGLRRRDKPIRSSNLLTRRESDILALLDRGVDLPTASDRLGISVNTTRGYVKNLYRKLDVHSQVELLAVARDKGLLDETPANRSEVKAVPPLFDRSPGHLLALNQEGGSARTIRSGQTAERQCG